MSALEHAPVAATFEGKLNAEGRVVVPVAIRRLLGVSSGDRLLFVSDADGNVRLTSVKAVIHGVWANNHGGDGGDSGEDVRRMREADRTRELEQLQDISQQDALDDRTDDEVANGLFASLNIPQ
jgi:bifunctional DNA-binding transcriptional regulator/antitoxin component of YhaV-PrlF toxin-antitoxin module